MAASACSLFLRDATHEPTHITLQDFTPNATQETFGNREADTLLLLSQIDHTQVASVALLQHIRCVVDGSEGQLAVSNAGTWPEIRLVSRAGTEREGRIITSLPAGCSGTSEALHSLSRLVDYRCHVPGGQLGRRFAGLRSPLQCLNEVVRGDLSPSLTAQLIGRDDASAQAREKLRTEASLLLSQGLEERIASRLQVKAAALPEPCCSVAPCTSGKVSRAAGSASLLFHEREHERPPAPGQARHPLSFGQLEPLTAGDDVEANARGETRRNGTLLAEMVAPLVADGASILPRRFDPRYRNPCWRCNGSSVQNNRITAVETLCCLPYAHIIGVSKCGTTDLFARLIHHQRYVLRSSNKGPHFWDEDHSFGWYVGLYSRDASKLLDGRRPNRAIFLDASSNTLTFTGVGVRGKHGADSPRVTIPHVLRWLQPSARILLMLREPSSRYYSAYGYYNRRYHIYKRYGAHGAIAFGKMADTEIDLFARCRLRSTARRCARSKFGAAEQLIKGMYSVFLSDWVGVFPSERLLVLRLEDYTERLEVHLQAVFAFLSLPPPEASEWKRMIAQKPINRRPPGGEEMLDATRLKLLHFYSEFNEQLAIMLDDPSYLKWHVSGSDNQRQRPASTGLAQKGD